MSDLAGSLGEGMVIVLQPATSERASIQLALGIQRFWQRTLKAAGRPAGCLIAYTQVESFDGPVPDDFPIAVGDRNVLRVDDWSDEVLLAGLVLEHGGRWGLAATLDHDPERGTLDTVLLEGKRRKRPRVIARWTFDGPFADFPDHVCGVVHDVARRLGTKLAWAETAEAFDTNDPTACCWYLEQMGILAMVEEGVRLEIPEVLERLAELIELAPRAAPVVALVPELLGHLAGLGAHDLQLAAWMRRVRQSAGPLPPEWDDLLDTISRARR